MFGFVVALMALIVSSPSYALNFSINRAAWSMGDPLLGTLGTVFSGDGLEARRVDGGQFHGMLLCSKPDRTTGVGKTSETHGQWAVNGVSFATARVFYSFDLADVTNRPLGVMTLDPRPLVFAVATTPSALPGFVCQHSLDPFGCTTHTFSGIDTTSVIFDPIFATAYGAILRHLRCDRCDNTVFSP